MTQKKWRFGIVGCGLIADFHARALQSVSNAELGGIFDLSLEKAREKSKTYQCRSFQTLEAMLEDPDIDAITIATPSGAHLEPAVAAAKAGKHVLCEKPLEITLERVDAMIEAHRQAGTQLGGIFQNRFNDAVALLQQAIKEERFGVMTHVGVYVPWWREDAYYHNSWHGSWVLDGGGAMMNQSIHMIDMLCHLLPPVKEVQAFTGTIGQPQIETEDTAVAILRLENGALGTVYGTTASYPGQFKRFEVTGTRGTAIYCENGFSVWQFADEKAEDKQVREQFRFIDGPGGVANPADISFHLHAENFRQFIRALEGLSDFTITGEQARQSVELILAMYEAAQTKKAVVLNHYE